jgi:wyosine [tRNA(Phe)-imidazoG37] synthetase (radical SAM superfamily)
MKYIFGPVPSRRLGNSLGIDLIPFKTCSFDCIYCQLGKTTTRTISRKEYIPVKAILSELKEILKEKRSPDYLTLSGSGEPTLNSGIGKLIQEIKKLTSLPIAVLTNGSLLFREKVRQELKGADLIIPSLDSAVQSTFEQINRPFKSLNIEQIIEGIRFFRQDFKGNIYLEIMLVKGINDTPTELKRLADAIQEIRPTKVQLNTVVRPPAEDFAQPLIKDEMQAVKDKLGERVEIISEYDRRQIGAHKTETESEIIKLVRRRPVTLTDISNSLGIHPAEAAKYIETLTRKGLIGYRKYGKEKFYRVHHRRGRE